VHGARFADGYDWDMQNDPLVMFRFVAGFFLVASITAGALVMKNAERLFGVDAEVPSEGASARTYSALLVYAVLAHALVFFSIGVLFL
jgi:hypothetical protein